MPSLEQAMFAPLKEMRMHQRLQVPSIQYQRVDRLGATLTIEPMEPSCIYEARDVNIIIVMDE